MLRAHRLHTWVYSDTKIAGLYKPKPGCEVGWGPFSTKKFLEILSLSCMDFGTYPGYSISACTIAFLGGTERSIWKDSIYGVHQARMECRDPTHARPSENSREDASLPLCPDAAAAYAKAQVMAGDLIAYVQEMGVDPELLTEGLTYRPDVDPRKEMNPLSEAQMKKYRIIYKPMGVQWSLENTSTGEFFLQQITTTEWKTNYIGFICRRNPDPRLVIMVIYDPANASGSEDIEKIIASGQLGVELHNTPPGRSPTHNEFIEEAPKIVLGPEELIRYPFRTDDGKVELVILASRRVLDALHTSTYFGINNREKDFVDFGAADPIDRTRLDTFIASCH